MFLSVCGCEATFPDNFEKPSFRCLLFALSSNITIIISILTFFFLFEAFYNCY